ncbi:hypothetical protein [Rubrivirga sp. IMCC43871]|uniref:hypothetical protein n=1 Tax=Rubrivirga sp. IMCC43871 TaxID=3391575 RepID=UPI0039902C12
MAGPALSVETIPSGGGAPEWAFQTKELWRPALYVLMGAPGTTGRFADGRVADGRVQVPVDAGRAHFGRQYESLFRWVLPAHGALDRLAAVGMGTDVWRALRRAAALFSSEEHLDVLRLLARGYLSAVTIAVDLDTRRSDVSSAYTEAEEERRERVDAFNRILGRLGRDDVRGLLAEPALAVASLDNDAGTGVLRWLSSERYRTGALDHPLLTEEEVHQSATLLAD